MKALKTTVAAIALLAGSAGQPALADSMFDQGLQDRTAWEQWFNNLQGDYKTGAFYWSGQRSLPQPGSCQQMDADFYRGCTDAKIKLATSDALRKTEPAYKVGWNSYLANVGPIAAPEMASTPAPAPQVRPAPPAAVVDEPTVNLPAAPAQAATVEAKAAPRAVVKPGLMPPVEKAFIQAVEDAKLEYDAGANDMAKGASRPHRKTALCSLLHSGGLSDWTGTIAELSSNSDGKGVLIIKIAQNVTVKTWNNSISDILDHTLIDPASAMYRQLVTLKEGDKVTFTGSFPQSDSDCVREASLTQRGSMTDPEFIVRFAEVRSH